MSYGVTVFEVEVESIACCISIYWRMQAAFIILSLIKFSRLIHQLFEPGKYYAN